MGDVYGCLMSGDAIALRYFYHKPRVDKQSFAVQPCTRKVRSLARPSCWVCGGGSRPAPGLHFSCGVFWTWWHGQSSAPSNGTRFPTARSPWRRIRTWPGMQTCLVQYIQWCWPFEVESFVSEPCPFTCCCLKRMEWTYVSCSYLVRIN